jgi:hypothetical protein
MRDWHYGRLDSASAVLANGRLRVRVDGVHPGGEMDVMLSAYAPDPNGSADVELGLYWRSPWADPAGRSVPYTARAEVPFRGMHAAVVRIYHASGFVDLRVRHAFPAAWHGGWIRPVRE